MGNLKNQGKDTQDQDGDKRKKKVQAQSKKKKNQEIESVGGDCSDEDGNQEFNDLFGEGQLNVDSDD